MHPELVIRFGPRRAQLAIGLGPRRAQLHPELAIWLGSIVHTVTTTWERSTVDEEEKEKKEEEG